MGQHSLQMGYCTMTRMLRERQCIVNCSVVSAPTQNDDLATVIVNGVLHTQ